MIHPLRNCLRFIFFFFLIFNSCQQKKSPDEIQSTRSDTNQAKDRLKDLSDKIMKDPASADPYYQRAKIFFNKKILQQAFLDVSKAVSLDSSRPEYYLLLADVCFQGLQIEKAVQAFNRCLTLNPNNLEANLKAAELHLYIKAYLKSIQYANAALKLERSNSRAYFIKGFDYKEMGDTALAISSFETVVELEPENYDAFIQLGILHAARNEPIALQYYNSAVRLRPRSTEALYDRGLFLQNSGELEKAKSDYFNILALDSNYADAYYNLGFIDLVYTKNYTSARKYFTDAIFHNKDYAEAYFNRGLCFEYSGDKTSALKDYKKALGIFPGYQLAKNRLLKLSK